MNKLVIAFSVVLMWEAREVAYAQSTCDADIVATSSGVANSVDAPSLDVPPLNIPSLYVPALNLPALASVDGPRHRARDRQIAGFNGGGNPSFNHNGNRNGGNQDALSQRNALDRYNAAKAASGRPWAPNFDFSRTPGIVRMVN